MLLEHECVSGWGLHQGPLTEICKNLSEAGSNCNESEDEGGMLLAATALLLGFSGGAFMSLDALGGHTHNLQFGKQYCTLVLIKLTSWSRKASDRSVGIRRSNWGGGIIGYWR